MTSLPCGTWPSPLSADDVAAGTVTLGWPRLVGDEVWWTEERPAEGGRNVVVRRRADGSKEDLLPAPWNARTRLHEYGGASWTAAGGALVFASFDDQRLWLLANGAAEPVPLTPEPAEAAGDRYAELLVVGPELWCVRERHLAGAVTRALVAVPLDGSAAAAEGPLAGSVHELVAGSDFLAFPRLSPDGRHLAWVAWDHPQMPWDGTELRVAEVLDGRPGPARTLLGGPTESVLQPEWRGDATLAVLTDRSGWWDLVQTDLEGHVQPLVQAGADLAGPLWQLGMAWYAVLADGRLVVRLDDGLTVVSGAERRPLPSAYTEWAGQLHTDGRRVVAVAGSSTAPRAVVVVDLEEPPAADGPPSEVDVVHTGAELPLDAAWLPVPTRETFPSVDGRVVHALVYAPCSPVAAVPAGELPPYVVVVHGGPTSQARAGVDLEKAYFTSRGIGVVDVDYGGSTGYGRAYRETLRGQWGVVDVEDCVAAVQGLVDQGRADGHRLLVRGGSAGGWTVLAALTSTDVFAAGTSYYGVAELLRFAEDTHDFESRYLDGLIGPLPESRALYEERAPLSHVDDLSCPVLLLQGDEDLVVPPSQAELFRDALVRKGLPHAYVLFEGEQHGFRRAETIVAALEAELSFYGQVLGFTPPGIPVLPLVR